MRLIRNKRLQPRKYYMWQEFGTDGSTIVNSVARLDCCLAAWLGCMLKIIHSGILLLYFCFMPEPR